ncbi:hypothetical protein BH10ACT1_BH10ACT1_11990 [soil metagenome]
MTSAASELEGPGRGNNPDLDLEHAVEKGEALAAAAFAAERWTRPAGEFGDAVRAAVAHGASIEEVADATAVSESTIERIAGSGSDDQDR